MLLAMRMALMMIMGMVLMYGEVIVDAVDASVGVVEADDDASMRLIRCARRMSYRCQAVRSRGQPSHLD